MVQGKLLRQACLLCILHMTRMTASQTELQSCMLNNENGCMLGRPPIYMLVAPRRVRAGQVVQVFATILRMEYGHTKINMRVSVTQGTTEMASSEILFDRPSSRIMQLLMPSNVPSGIYSLRVQGTLEDSTFGNIFYNETDIEFSSKQASVFIQMSQPLYRQGQKVHFRVIPVFPDLMPKYDSMTIYVEDPNKFSVRRWPIVQPSAGGLVTESFQLADQPTYGIWRIKVLAFGYEYSREFPVEEFWEPRFDVNVTVPTYIIENFTSSLMGTAVANHTSGRPCKGNGTVTAYFMPREEIWNKTQGWLKDFRRQESLGLYPRLPEYFPLSSVHPKDFHLYLEYDYRFIDYYEARFNFEWTFENIRKLAQRAGVTDTLVGSSVMFFVNMTDWYTSLNRTGWASTTIYDPRVQLKLIGESVRSFKPISLLNVQVAVMYSDGKPVINPNPVMFEVVMSGSGTGPATKPATSIVPVDGIAQFAVMPEAATEHIIVRASYSRSENDVVVLELRANRYYSPTNNYISIKTSTENPRVNEYMIFHIRTSHFIPRVFYQVIAQSNIIIGDELEMTSKQKTFAIALSREMIPTARIVVYYIRQPEEIVSDALTFFINGIQQNKVEMTVNYGKDFSTKTIELNAFADPGSYLATSTMLYDLYDRGLNDGLTENKLMDELSTYDSGARGVFRHLWRTSNSDFEYKHFSGGDYGIDPNTTFSGAGLIVLTDVNLARIPNIDQCPRGQFRCISETSTESCLSIELKCNGVFDACEDGSDEYGCDYKNNTLTTLAPIQHQSRVMRFYEDSSWGWKEIFIKPDGRVDFRVQPPKYPLLWYFNAISISRDNGLGIMSQPLFHDGTKRMYIIVEHPPVIVRGEQVGIRVSVFNNWDDDDYFEVLLTLQGSDDFDFVLVGNLGYVSAYSPETHKGDHQTILFLEPRTSKDIYFPIVASKHLVQGRFTFHITAKTFILADEYYGTITVIPDGVMNYYHTPYLVDLIRYASIDVPDFSVQVPENFRVPGQWRYSLYIPGSAKACVSTFGDVVTPGFFEDYLNAENVLRRPYGGGEMITFNFAYNLFTLRFMKTSEQLTNERLQIALEEMNIAFQRMMSYMNPHDGSFKMFQDDEKSSLWLTAFVAKTLHWARFGEWERQLFIPVELLNKITLYICSRQNKTTGAFIPDEQPAYDYKMSSLNQARSGPKMTNPIPLTAYVLIALNKLIDVSEEAAHCRDDAILLATEYLAGQVDSIPDDEVFHLAITSYALSFGSIGRIESREKLSARLRNDSNEQYFSDQRVYENPSEFLTNVRYLKPRQELLNDAYAVQTTAYALLSYIKQNEPDVRTNSLMRWLNTMRNTIGGFASTQDTIVALEALYEFALQDRNRNVFNLEFNIQSTASDWSKIIDIKQDFYSKLTYDCIPVVWGAIRSSVDGTGRALLQLTTTVNVEYDFLIKKTQKIDMTNTSDAAPTIKFFDLFVDKIEWHGRNFSVMEMWPCMSWVYTERSLTTGLSVLEVDIPTGYVVMNNTLRDYVQSGVVPNLKRAEFYDRKVVFYFSFLDTTRTCVHLRADRWYPVANSTIQHRMRVYDYYEPGMHNTTLYTTFNLFQQNICYSCGSYQCPYCPFFNVASVLKATVTLFSLIMGFLLQGFLLH